MNPKTENIIKEMKKYPLFFQKVWTACMEIPAGETRSYKWIADRIGSPKAFHAVGSALAKNPFAPIVPCHRVICSDGRIGGYSANGGTRTKTKLIKKERRNR